MTERQLERIEVEGFTSIRFAAVSLGRLNVLVGANGAGKSNFIHALAMLGRIVDSELNLFVGMNGGAAALLNSAGSATRIRLDASPNSYEASLVHAANDELIFDDERIFYHGHGQLDRWQHSIGRGHRETGLHDVVDTGPGLSVASHMIDLLRGCRVFHFHDTSADAPVKRHVSTADNVALRDDAGNLAAVLYSLQDVEPATYRRIVGAIRQVAPFFRDFVLRPEKNDLIRLRWREADSDAVFSANQMSDGTLRFVCLATLLLRPSLPALVVLDEPELGLHPSAIVQLAGLLRQASAHSQVLIATQSVTLMNQFDIDDLIVVERRKGASRFSRPDRDRLSEWLAHYSLGDLWEKNLIGGRPGDTGSHD
jgi:predicted ATPase